MRFPVTTFLSVGLAITLVVFCAMLFYCRSFGLPVGTLFDAGDSANVITRNLHFPVEIEARGRQFKWRFRYPGRDGIWGSADDLQVENDLHLPVGVEVELKLESDDFIYILYNPERRFKQIAVPEITHTLKFATKEVGSFDLKTDPMCGWRPLHDDLMGRVIIQSVADFNDWFDKSVVNQASLQ